MFWLDLRIVYYETEKEPPESDFRILESFGDILRGQNGEAVHIWDRACGFCLCKGKVSMRRGENKKRV